MFFRRGGGGGCGGALGPRKDVSFQGNQAKSNEKIYGEGEGSLIWKNGLTSFMYGY